MSLVRDIISNFIGGVSQQPDKIMYPNQSRTLNNYLLNISDGLQKRPPTEHVARLMDSLSLHPYVHTIIKENEKYKVFLTGDSIKVFDLEGNEKQVHYGTIYEVKKDDTIGYTSVRGLKDDYCKEDTKIYSDYQLTTELEEYTPTEFIYTWNPVAEIKEQLANYITSDAPLKELDASTIGDYTFILNKTKIVQFSDELSPNPHPNSALIFVRQGDYTTDYKIKVNGEEKASYTTTDDVKTTKTNGIASELKNKLDSSLGSGWSTQLQNSCILLNKDDGSEFTILATDSNADYNLYAFYKEANSLQLLPTVAPNGFILKIVGEEIAVTDDYYVKFETTDGSDFGSGTWIETSAPNIPYKIDANTMPHGLVREADGFFTFKALDWTPRDAGDEDTAPSPSFIGNTIQEVFTHKGRLSFLSMDKSCYSDTQDIFSFFKKTTQTELDTDPIDVTSNSKMVDLKHALAYNETLLLFSPTTEFTIKSGDIFSNSTVAIDLTMNYQCSSYCKPVNAGNTAFFLYENGNYSKMMEVYVTSTYNFDAREVTEQIPSFLPKNIYKIAASSANNIACLLSTEHTDTIYVYNYYYSSESKVQSAWSKWTFDNTKILNIDFYNNWLYLTVQYEDGIYLLRLDFSPKKKEPNLEYQFFLDRKVYLDETDLIYDEITNITSFELPYSVVSQITILEGRGFPLDYIIEDNIVKVQGNYTKLIIGNTYESRWELSPIYVRQTSSNGGMKVKEGILMLKDINMTYADTGYFRVIVTPKYSTAITSSFEFTGKITGLVSATLEQIPVSDGTYLIPIASKNDEVTVEIINDSYLPSDFLSLEWLGEFVIRGQ